MPTELVFDIDKFYQPHINQVLIHQSVARIKVLKCGRRFGKGRAAVGEILRIYQYLYQQERSVTLVPRICIWVVAPTYKQIDGPWRELKEFVPNFLITRKVEDEKVIELLGDCVITMRSADQPEHLQNIGLDALWVTEASSIKDEVWHNQLRPTLISPGRFGRAIVESRPSRPDNWFEQLFEQGQNPENKGYIESWHFTSYDNPLIDPKDIDSLKEITPEAAFAQEYMAETQADMDRAFNNIDNCIGGNLDNEPEAGRSYVIGVDPAKRVDFAVYIVMDRERRRVVDFYRYSNVDYTIQREKVRELSERWNEARVILDSSGIGDVFYDMLREVEVSVRPIGFKAEKGRIHSNLIVAIERETIKFPRYARLIKELRMARRVLNTKGQVEAMAPESEHDDCIDALALALEGCYRQSRQLFDQRTLSRNWLETEI